MPTGLSHDRLQDEVVIINVGSGAYYSAAGTAADIWTVVSQGASAAEAAVILAPAYATDAQSIQADIDNCISSLVERGLIEIAGETGRGPELSLPESIRAAWHAPEFQEYTDMWELIKLDPIHEVDEVGWPVPKA